MRAHKIGQGTVEFAPARHPAQDPVSECFRELFLGPTGESAEQSRARLAAARDVLAELWEQGESDSVARQDALYAANLSAQARRTGRTGAARTPWRRSA